MRRIVQVVLLSFAASMVIFALTRAPDANASVDYTSPYTLDQTYGAGVRLLHVDLGLKILEKDRDLGYVLFEYTSSEAGNSVYQGSMEFVETKSGVHVAIQIPSMPQYHERMIVDKLSRKLAAEYGDPPQRHKDGDKDKDKSDGDKDKDKDKSDGDKDKDKSDGNKDKSDSDHSKN